MRSLPCPRQRPGLQHRPLPGGCSPLPHMDLKEKTVRNISSHANREPLVKGRELKLYPGFIEYGPKSLQKMPILFNFRVTINHQHLNWKSNSRSRCACLDEWAYAWFTGVYTQCCNMDYYRLGYPLIWKMSFPTCWRIRPLDLKHNRFLRTLARALFLTL